MAINYPTKVANPTNPASASTALIITPTPKVTSKSTSLFKI